MSPGVGKRRYSAAHPTHPRPPYKTRTYCVSYVYNVEPNLLRLIESSDPHAVFKMLLMLPPDYVTIKRIWEEAPEPTTAPDSGGSSHGPSQL